MREVLTKAFDKAKSINVMELNNNVSELHKQLFNEENYIPSDTVKQISQDIINDTGYDMSILDE